MKKYILSLLSACFALVTQATHITGGEMYYSFNGVVGGEYQYFVTLKLYQRCNSGRQFPNPTIISIFDKTTGARFTDLYIPISNTENISITNPDPCITNPPPVCYDVAYYSFSVSLPASARGYVLASQVNYRINGISNLVGGQIGATYTAEIPGTANDATHPQNHSAKFTGSDLVIVCAENDFSYSFAAEDVDGDQLRYSFCEAYASSNPNGGTASPTGPPPFPQVPYNGPLYSDIMPLGNRVRINSTTGLITGIAPPQGIYVITVCVEEIRDGVVIAIQRKDVQINVADCDVASATLLPEYLLCGNSQSVSISNLSSSPLIVSYEWKIEDRLGNILATSNTTGIAHTFADTGLYTVKLRINGGQPCTDSTSAPIRVYPGFVADFGVTGICVGKPTIFNDQSSSVYGTVNSWNWDFGESSGPAGISTLQDPTHTFNQLGPKNVTLLVTDSKGCRDTISKTVTIIDKPVLSLGFRDSLICLNDIVQLAAIGSGNFTWTPALNIINPNTASPTVSPPSTTTYIVELNDNGCINKDSVRVRVVDRVTLIPMNDTTICQGDTIRLRVVSDGFQYSWSPASQLIDPQVKNPIAITNIATRYQVTATLGGCTANAGITVNPVPYPLANAGADTSICYNSAAQLKGATNGSSWSWSPAQSLNQSALLNPIAYPPRTTTYIFSAFDNRGCPKPGRDTVTVTVFAKMNVHAGNDTAVLVGQTLQLQASGGENYSWSPETNLSSPDIGNPVALFDSPSEGIRYKLVASSANGCQDSAFLLVKVFATGPTVFVPAAFTPNNDGLNDILRPLGVGMKQLNFFRVFNRWGEMVYTTSINGQGWDGRIRGQVQSTNTYVWVVSAVDLNGRLYLRKGVVTLIR